VRTGKITVNTTLAALDITASVQGRINLVLGDEHSHLRHFCHIGGIFTPWQVKVLQSVPNLNGLVVVETHHITVCFVGIHKSGVIGRQHFTESVVFQILCEPCGRIGKTASAVVLQSAENILLPGFIAQIPTDIPQLMRKLGTLVKLRFGKLHIGGVFTLVHKLTDTLGGILPGNDLCGLGISRRSAFGKVNAVLGIPYRELTTLGL